MVGKDPTEMLYAVVRKMVRDSDEIVTVYWGADVDSDSAATAEETLRAGLSDSVEVEFHEGGQPLYYYIVSVE
jgi:dihydroxyacetone kinase-like predicted kinase